MTNEPPPNDRLKSIWQNQPTEGIQMSIDEIRIGRGSSTGRYTGVTHASMLPDSPR